MRKFLILLILLILVTGGLLAPSWQRFRAAEGVVPAGVRLAGLDVAGLDQAGLGAVFDRYYQEPVAVYYGGQRIILRPQAVSFGADVNSMLAEARTRQAPVLEVGVFLAGMAGLPLAPLDVPLRYKLDEAALDRWLDDVGARYDHPPVPAQPNLTELTLAPGRPGQTMDRQASRPRLVAALLSRDQRRADLVLSEVPAPPPDMTALGELLKARLKDFPGIASVFLHDTTTGQEIAIDADVAYAGMSTMKIAILTELFRKLDAPPDVATTKLITETTSLSGNYTANLLLGIIDDGSAAAGARILTESLGRMGLKNTFMAAPYDAPSASAPRIVTEANSRKDLNTQPDPFMQTTPRDMGLMLEMLVECSQGGGTLLAAYPGQLNQDECARVLGFIDLNEMNELITAGVPQGTRVIHKHGYGNDTHGDVAAIWGPAGPYVLSIFLYRPPWLEWSISNPTMKDLSRAVWNYYSLVAGH